MVKDFRKENNVGVETKKKKLLKACQLVNNGATLC